MSLWHRPAALLALAVMGGCSSSSEVVLTVKGEAPGAVTLLVRLVDATGAPKEVRSAGDADHPVQLPATVYLQLSHADRIGVAVWVADGGGTIVARAMTDACVPVTSGNYDLILAPAPDGWTPASIDGCLCEGDRLVCAADSPTDASVPDDAAPATDVVAEDAGVDLPAPSALDATPDLALDAVNDADADAARSPDASARDGAADGARPDAARDAAPAKPDAAVAGKGDAGATPATPVRVPSTLFGFELAAPDWSSPETTLARDTTVHTEGAASLSFTVPAGGTSTLKSRSFMTADLALAANTRMSVDIFVGAKQTGDANTEMWVDCQSAGVYGIYMGYKALSALKVGAWTPVTFKLPDVVAGAFAGKFTDCQVWFQLVGKGLFRYDRMGFAVATVPFT